MCLLLHVDVLTVGRCQRLDRVDLSPIGRLHRFLFAQEVQLSTALDLVELIQRFRQELRRFGLCLCQLARLFVRLAL